MWKKIFAASAVASGIIGLLGGGGAFAKDAPFIGEGSYASGQTISPWVSDFDVCVDKSGGYSGGMIVADIWGTNFSTQVVFDGFTANRSCVPISNTPSNRKLKFVTPMDLSNMEYVEIYEDDLSGGMVILDLDDAVMSNKYLRSYGQSTTRIGKSATTINFDANGGTGTLPVIAGATVGSNVTLPKSTLTRTGYRFAGWNTKADGSGTSYADEATISIAEIGQIQLFAQWSPEAMLDSGYVVSQKLRRLANPENAASINYFSENNNIKAIRTASALPNGFDITDENHIISVNNTAFPASIYTWFDNSDNNNDGDADGIIYIYTDADKIYGNSTMNYAFYLMKSLTDISALSTWDMSKTSSLLGMFRASSLLSDISVLSNWDTSNVTDMGELFAAASALTDITPLSCWNVSQVTNMESMIGGTGIVSADALETKRCVGKSFTSWDVSNVTNMDGMFGNDSSLSDISALASWDVSNVTSMYIMFYSDSSLSDISALASWNTSNVENMSTMFNRMSSLADISALASWNTSNVINMSGMFGYTSSLVDISALASWNTSSVTNMSWMFGFSAVVDVGPLMTMRHTGNDYISWDVSRVTRMDSMFSHARSLSNISALASWDTSSVTDMHYMFAMANSLADISSLETKRHAGNNYTSWDVSNVTDMNNMFFGTALTNVSALASWNTSSVTNMRDMFFGNPLADISPLAYWNTSSVTDMSDMFAQTKITNVNALETKQHVGRDYVSWDVSNVVDMHNMFFNDYSLADISALASWNTSSVTNMSDMFTSVPARPLPSWYH